MNKCPKCNQKIPKEAKFCSECGEKITNASNEKNGPSDNKNLKSDTKNKRINSKQGCLGCSGFIIVVLLIFAGIGFIFSDDTTKVTTAEKKAINNVNYNINKIEDYSFATAKRYNVDVVVNGPVNIKELKIISKIITKKVKKEHKFNALVIGFYDYPEYINNGYTLGKATFAPGGDWSMANTIDTGDYDKMKFNYKFRKKDWSKRLTKNEVRIWSAWKLLYRKIAEKDISKIPDENQITNTIAKRFDITVNKVNNILNKQVTWTYEGAK